nr:transglutaminase-like cysteine peptidase [Bradyrhizobium sp. Leo170]
MRTFSGELVLDNPTQNIMPWSRKPYRWVRIQLPKNPNYWVSRATATPDLKHDPEKWKPVFRKGHAQTKR